MKKTGYLILLICLLQIACTRNSKTLESAQEPCDSDSIDIYCLLNNYYVPNNFFKELPVKMSTIAPTYKCFTFKSFDNKVFVFLKDSFEFSDADFEFSEVYYDSASGRYYNSEDTIPFNWEKSRLKNVDFVCKHDIDSFNDISSKKSYAYANELFTSLFDKGYVCLSRPLISKNKKLVLIVEEVLVINSCTEIMPLYVFFKHSNKWHVRKFQDWWG